jgi:hypothetical protein
MNDPGQAGNVLRAVAVAPIAEVRSVARAVPVWRGEVGRSAAVLAVVVLLIAARSLAFGLWDDIVFNSDHAIVGLMAKHLAEGRAFPLFFYGQSYMLGVEAWLAAPLMLVAGPTVMAVELPLIALNALVACLLILMLRRELRLGAVAALGAAIVFVLAPPATALGLVEANGGSVEPFLYVLLLWLLRARPALFGLTLAFGVLHREFTLYALPALAVMRLFDKRPVRNDIRWIIVAGVWCLVLFAAVQGLRAWASPLGPGTSGGIGGVAATNISQLARRACWQPARLSAVWRDHLDVLFGTGPHSLRALGLRTRMAGQGRQGASLLFAVLFAAVLGRTAWLLRSVPARRVWFAGYLAVIGGTSILVYGLVGCDRVSPDTLRYDLLGLLLAVGVAGAFFRVESWKVSRAVAVGGLALWAGLSLQGHGRLWTEYLGRPRLSEAAQAAAALEAAGVRHAKGNYWVAYRLTFLSGERTTIASTGPVRIAAYQNPGEPIAVIVQESPCEGGVRLAGRFYRCPSP